MQGIFNLFQENMQDEKKKISKKDLEDAAEAFIKEHQANGLCLDEIAILAKTILFSACHMCGFSDDEFSTYTDTQKIFYAHYIQDMKKRD